jgi:glycosyltransferase involved in cell wall biosynthesis
MQIALLGTRGIPARYGGFETFAEQLSCRLVQRGHQVTVYARRPFFSQTATPAEFQGVSIQYCPTIFHKYLETPLHALTSFLHLFTTRFDVALLCNAANSPFAFLVNLRRVPLAINVDGIERRRSKWNALGRLWYQLGERASVCFADRVVSDAQVIADYYQERYSCSSSVIAYGALALRRPAGTVLAELGVKPGEYLLYVSRLEPENNALGVIQAYAMLCSLRSAEQLPAPFPLVIVGDAPYASEYKDSLRAAVVPGVIFAGFRFAEAYQELQSHCYLYIQATEVGGTHPALIEAMAYGNCVLANSTPENREVLAESGEFYPLNDFRALAELMARMLVEPEQVKQLGQRAHARATAVYDWEAITSQYERLFQEMLGNNSTSTVRR